MNKTTLNKWVSQINMDSNLDIVMDMINIEVGFLKWNELITIGIMSSLEVYAYASSFSKRICYKWNYNLI
jgi:hypothetical protein